MHSYSVKKGRIKEFYVDALSKDVLGFVNIFHDIVGFSSPGEGWLMTKFIHLIKINQILPKGWKSTVFHTIFLLFSFSGGPSNSFWDRLAARKYSPHLLQQRQLPQHRLSFQWLLQWKVNHLFGLLFWLLKIRCAKPDDQRLELDEKRAMEGLFTYWFLKTSQRLPIFIL